MPRETGMRCLVSPRHSGLMQIMPDPIRKWNNAVQTPAAFSNTSLKISHLEETISIVIQNCEIMKKMKTTHGHSLELSETTIHSLILPETLVMLSSV